MFSKEMVGYLCNSVNGIIISCDLNHLILILSNHPAELGSQPATEP